MGHSASALPPVPPPAPAPIIIQAPIQSTVQPPSIILNLLNQEQLQKATNDNFTLYNLATRNPIISKLAVNLPNLQQCFDNNGSTNCINQYIKGFDNSTNTYQDLVSSESNITADSGGNIIIPQNFENIENNNCNKYFTNNIILLLLTVFIVVLVIKYQ